MSTFEIFWSIAGMLLITGITCFILGIIKNNPNITGAGGCCVAVFGFSLLFGLLECNQVTYTELDPSKIIKGQKENTIIYLKSGESVVSYDEGIFYLPDNEICIKKIKKVNIFKTVSFRHRVKRCSEQ